MHRTGRNPQNLFIQLGCSKVAEHKMLHYVKAQCVGKPFSNYAMVRSLFWPRETDHTSFFCAGALACCTRHVAPSLPPPPPPHLPPFSLFCAELVASILKVGGLLDATCNPGSATPEMLHRIYAPRAAVSANPCLLRELHQHSPGAAAALGAGGNFIGNLSHAERLAEREALVPRAPASSGGGGGGGGSMAMPRPTATAAPRQMSLVVPQPFQPARRRAESPPRGHFQVVSKQCAPLGISGSACTSRCAAGSGIQLTMHSLQFGGTGGSSGTTKGRLR